MRHISEGIASALTQGAAKLCHVWLIERGDGVTLGFTDHDRDLPFLGIACQAQSGLTAGASDQRLGEASGAAISGVIASEAIRGEDIAAGFYDGARIRSYVVDWLTQAQVQTGSGTLARFEARGESFIAHVEGPLAQLDMVIGRRFGTLCDAALGDARCGLDPADLPQNHCNKRYNTCINIFANAVNFRGFPDLPGEDFLTVYPRNGDVLDGRSRGQGSGR